MTCSDDAETLCVPLADVRGEVEMIELTDDNEK